MQKSIRMSYTLGSAICLILMITVAFMNIYPCGYWDQAQLFEEEGYAGYGHYSLVEVVGNGFFWEADDIPEPNPDWRTLGPPFYVVGYWWVTLLYIPIFLGIIFLGWLISGGRERIGTLLNKKTVSN